MLTKLKIVYIVDKKEYLSLEEAQKAEKEYTENLEKETQNQKEIEKEKKYEDIKSKTSELKKLVKEYMKDYYDYDKNFDLSYWLK